MKLILLGQPRTGTMSIWNFFKLHPEVSTSVPKEYLRKSIENLYDYISRAHHVNDKTKILLDGSPGIFYKDYRIKFIFNAIKDAGINHVVQLYTIRDPVDQLVSLAHVRIRSFLNGTPPCPNHFNAKDKSLDEDELHEMCISTFNEYDNILRAENTIGKENIFFVNLKDFESRQKEIFDFLGIDSTVKYTFPHTNSTWQLGYTMEQLKIKNKIISFVNSRMNEYKPIIEESQRKRKERYGI
jgi:hypothetical protein